MVVADEVDGLGLMRPERVDGETFSHRGSQRLSRGPRTRRPGRDSLRVHEPAVRFEVGEQARQPADGKTVLEQRHGTREPRRSTGVVTGV